MNNLAKIILGILTGGALIYGSVKLVKRKMRNMCMRDLNNINTCVNTEKKEIYMKIDEDYDHFIVIFKLMPRALDLFGDKLSNGYKVISDREMIVYYTDDIVRKVLKIEDDREIDTMEDILRAYIPAVIYSVPAILE